MTDEVAYIFLSICHITSCDVTAQNEMVLIFNSYFCRSLKQKTFLELILFKEMLRMLRITHVQGFSTRLLN